MVSRREKALSDFKKLLLGGANKTNIHTQISTWKTRSHIGFKEQSEDKSKFNIYVATPSVKDIDEFWQPLFHFIAIQKYLQSNPLAEIAESYLIQFTAINDAPLRQLLLAEAQKVIQGLLIAENNPERIMYLKMQLRLIDAQFLKNFPSKELRNKVKEDIEAEARMGHIPSLILLSVQLRYDDENSIKAQAIEFIIHIRYKKERDILKSIPAEFKEFQTDKLPYNLTNAMQKILNDSMAVHCFNAMYQAFQNNQLAMDVRPSHIFKAIAAQLKILQEAEEKELLKFLLKAEEALYPPKKFPVDAVPAAQTSADKFVKDLITLKQLEDKQAATPVTVLFASSSKQHVHIGLPDDQDNIAFLELVITKGEEMKFHTDKLTVIRNHVEKDNEVVVRRALAILENHTHLKDYAEIKAILENKLKALSFKK